jgi:GNAT superfamily N-acetyltransferase
MRLLIDTNVLIPLEPTRSQDVEPGSRVAADLVRLAHQTGQQILIHPSSLSDLQRDGDPARVTARAILLRKYIRLEPSPDVALVEDVLGVAPLSSNDWVDHCLLAAVKADAVDYLVTQDGGIHRKATRLDVADRVLTVEDALAYLTTLHDRTPPALPAVMFEPVHTLDSSDQIFDSLRRDYSGFDEWLVRCKRRGRAGWIIHAPEGGYAAVSIIKPNDDDFRLGGRVLKLCTFKVSSVYQGNRYGELLLKALFNYCFTNLYDHLYVTVFEQRAELITLLEAFGFQCLTDARTDRGELVYRKDFARAIPDPSAYGPLEYHVLFGPPALQLGKGRVYVVPVRPLYHRLLFPELETQPELALVPRPYPQPYGNALRKAYLCNASIRRVRAGDTLLFYRSHDHRAVGAVGVVEETLVSRDPEAIISMVGQRTVYSFEQIHHLASSDVLTILFRQDRVLARPIAERELVRYGAIRRAPQSIASVPSTAVEWLAHRLDEQFSFPLGLGSPTQF